MEVKMALAGNPNCGKTTLFNALTGASQYVGNWPGVTVEKKEGRPKGRKEVTIVDLPGIYSLSPYTLEEVVARDFLIAERPDVIINVIDGTNLERNLYLSTQIMELGIPVLMAVNQMDLVEKSGDRIQLLKLGEAFGCEAVEISALKGWGVDKLLEKAVSLAQGQNVALPMHTFNDTIEKAALAVEEKIGAGVPAGQRRFFAIKLLEKDEKIVGQMENPPDVTAEIAWLEEALDDDAESIIANGRYESVSSVIEKCYVKRQRDALSISDKIDRIVTHRVLALPIFAAIMFLVYYVSVQTVGAFATDWMNDGVFGEGWRLFGLWVPGIPTAVEGDLNAIGCADWLKGLVLDGMIGGVGAVLGVFDGSPVPQIWPFRQVVHPNADWDGVRGSRHSGLQDD